MGKFTKQQRQAIEARGNVVVVAGAGTGKTRTLVHRCVEWLLEDPRKHSLDQVLVVTFTDAAAAELRQRIRAELTARLAVEPTNIHLLEQAALLDSAFISTLHSFCFRLLRQHFYELEIDPQVTVLPEEESRLLADETLRDMLERHFAGETRASEEVQKLIHAQARGWDVPVKRLILRLHEYAQTLPDPVGWLQSQRAAFCHSSPVEWRGWLHAAVLEWREQWTPVLQPFAGVKNVSDCLNALQRLPTNPTTDQAFTVLSDVGEAYRQVWPRGSVGKVRDVIQPFFDEAEFLRGLTQPAGQKPEDSSAPQLPGTPLEQDWSWVAPQMTVLLDLTAEFGERLSQAKKELGGVDFHDLEQFSLRLLWNGTTDQPTPLAMIWRERLQMIFWATPSRASIGSGWPIRAFFGFIRSNGPIAPRSAT